MAKERKRSGVIKVFSNKYILDLCHILFRLGGDHKENFRIV